MPVYAREGVRHAWLLDPVKQSLEIYAPDEGSRWGEAVVYRDAEVGRAVPFHAVELGLASLWAY